MLLARDVLRDVNVKEKTKHRNMCIETVLNEVQSRHFIALSQRIQATMYKLGIVPRRAPNLSGHTDVHLSPKTL